MKQLETVLVLKKLGAFQPNQQFDDDTHKAWAEKLRALDFEDALDAVGNLAVAPRMPGQPFLIELRDVWAEVGRIRAARLQSRRHLLPDPPSGLDAAQYREWLQAIEGPASERDWTPPDAAAELPRRDVLALTGGKPGTPADPDTIRAIRARKDRP